MDREQTERLILDIYRARKAGDAVGMTKNFHENATYRMNAGPPELAASFAGGQDKETVESTFDALLKEFIFEDDWKVVRFIHDDDASVLIWRGTVTSSNTKKSHFFEVCTVFVFKDGKIISVTDNTDTAAVTQVCALSDGHQTSASPPGQAKASFGG